MPPSLTKTHCSCLDACFESAQTTSVVYRLSGADVVVGQKRVVAIDQGHVWSTSNSGHRRKRGSSKAGGVTAPALAWKRALGAAKSQALALGRVETSTTSTRSRSLIRCRRRRADPRTAGSSWKEGIKFSANLLEFAIVLLVASVSITMIAELGSLVILGIEARRQFFTLAGHVRLLKRVFGSRVTRSRLST
jgi:hypothetical protein